MSNCNKSSFQNAGKILLKLHPKLPCRTLTKRSFQKAVRILYKLNRKLSPSVTLTLNIASITRGVESPASSKTAAAPSVLRIAEAGAYYFDDVAAVEEPLEIRLQQGNAPARSLTVTMRTPGHDAELAAGFLVTEGVLDDAAALQAIRISEPVPSGTDGCVLPVGSATNIVTVELSEDAQVRMASLERNFYTTSSCGICGKASLLALRSVCPPRRSNALELDFKVLSAMPEVFRAEQATFQQTGGLHAAALFSARGELQLLREDVGRHNAVDKLIGARFLLDELPLRDAVLMLSGRVSFELMQKAVMAGLPAVAAVGAPSSLAIAVAREFDVTLIGFLREDRCNVYHGAHRLRRGAQGGGT